MMDVRIEKLIAKFENKGWKLLGSVDVSKDWWFDDILELNSIWHPIGKQLFLTLLTDPEILKAKLVWSIGISTSIPNDNSSNFIATLSLNDLNKADLNQLVTQINHLVL